MEDARKAKCPICLMKFTFEENDEERDIILCPNCDSELEIESLYPPRVTRPSQMDNLDEEYDYEEEEDFDDYDIYDEDEFDDEDDF